MIDGKTSVYGIMGLPVSHSLSPCLHNAAFAALELNMAYVPFPVTDVGAALAGFRAAGVCGLSVTIPYKERVIPFLDAIDPVAAKIGAVNTLVIKDGNIKGFNTDWVGATTALKKGLALPGKKVLILGAGGSAKAIGFGLLEEGAEIALASRTPEKGQALAKLLHCPWQPLSTAGDFQADALVNATSVGMAPKSEALPIEAGLLSKFPVVMDIVYAPLQTRLLAAAEKAGCHTINGVAMLLYQGMAQFEIWTGQKAPEAVMQQALLNRLPQ